MKYRYFQQKLSFLKQISPSFCFKIYLNTSWYLFILRMLTHLSVLERFKGWTWYSYFNLFLRGAYIRGGLHSGFYGICSFGNNLWIHCGNFTTLLLTETKIRFGYFTRPLYIVYTTGPRISVYVIDINAFVFMLTTCIWDNRSLILVRMIYILKVF